MPEHHQSDTCINIVYNLSITHTTTDDNSAIISLANGIANSVNSLVKSIIKNLDNIVKGTSNRCLSNKPLVPLMEYYLVKSPTLKGDHMA